MFTRTHQGELVHSTLQILSQGNITHTQTHTQAAPGVRGVFECKERASSGSAHRCQRHTHLELASSLEELLPAELEVWLVSLKVSVQFDDVLAAQTRKGC